MGAPCTFRVPGTVVRVVKSISEASECVPVSFDISVDWIMKHLVLQTVEDIDLVSPSPLRETQQTRLRLSQF